MNNLSGGDGGAAARELMSSRTVAPGLSSHNFHKKGTP